MNMKRETNSLPLSCLEQMPTHICPCKDFLSPAGICAEPDPELGEGYYWYYEKEDMFAVAVMDLKLKKDYIMEYDQPDFISVNYYDTICAEELTPYKKVNANCIRGHVSGNKLFRAKYYKNIPIRGTELILMPGYYHDYLNEKYPGEFPDPESAFLSIDGSTDFPELVLLLKQIGHFQGSGMAAELYFSSKVAEALSLIIEKTKAHPSKEQEKPLSHQDLARLNDVKNYIEDHFAYEIKAETLCSIACMGQTKLRASFKQAYGYTITEYIQHRRVSHAEFLLLNTDFNVSQVAEAVGYHHAGRFSGLFKKTTGLLPDEYRKLMK